MTNITYDVTTDCYITFIDEINLSTMRVLYPADESCYKTLR